MSSREGVLACLRDTREQISAIVESMPADAWKNNVYEDGWNERQLLSNLASTSGPASFVLAMSRLRARSGAGGPAFDNDAFNKQQVAMREERSTKELLDEISANVQRDIQAIESASDEDLQRQWTAPWGAEGSVADIIIMSIEGHLGAHIEDLRNAAP